MSASTPVICDLLDFDLLKESPVKGPGMRLDLDVRRTWRCPACGAERRTSGDYTSVHCADCAVSPLMTLTERSRTLRPTPVRPDLTIGLHPDDVDAAPYNPSEVTAEQTETTVAEEASAPEPQQPEKEQPSRSGKRQPRRRPRRKPTGAEPPKESASKTETDRTSTPSNDNPQSPPPPETFGDGVLDGS